MRNEREGLACAAVWLVTVATGCGSVTASLAIPPDASGDASQDAPGDVPDGTGGCAHGAPFGAAALVANVNGPKHEQRISFTHDGLLAFISVDDATAATQFVYAATRADVIQPLSRPVLLTGPVNTASAGWAVSAADGLTLYFDTDRGGSSYGLYAATRPNRSAEFAAPAPIPVVDLDGANEGKPYLVRSTGALYFERTDDTTQTIWVAKRVGSSFIAPTPVTELGTQVVAAVVSEDEFEIFVTRIVPNEDGIYGARRTSTASPFGPMELVTRIFRGPPNGGASLISADNCVLYFSDTRPDGLGGDDLWYMSRR